jgi:hypothetical protein
MPAPASSLTFPSPSVSLHPPPSSLSRQRQRRRFLVVTGGSDVDRQIGIQRVHAAQHSPWATVRASRARRNGAVPAQCCAEPRRFFQPVAFFSLQINSTLLDLCSKIIRHLFCEHENDHIQISVEYLYKYLPCRASLWSK